MENFSYYNPVKVIFGNGTLREIGREAAAIGKKALLVSYKDISFLKNTITDIQDLLRAEGVEFVECFQATANPTLAEARIGINLCKENTVDLVIGVGGGSAMDCAKLIAAGVYYPLPLEKMIAFSHSDDSQVPQQKPLPMILVPTLAGTGSEMNSTAVVTDEKSKKKSYVWAPECLYAKTAIIDPALTVTLPKYQTACGAIDIVAHVLEGYFNGTSQNLDLQDAMMAGVIKTVLTNMNTVLGQPADLQARGVLQWCAAIALNGWVLSGTYTWAPMHQMGHAISAFSNATHGASLAVMMIAWMKFFENRPDNMRYEKFAEDIYRLPLKEATVKFEALCADAGIETRIGQFGIKEEDIPELVNQVVSISFSADGTLHSNPPLSRDDIEAIYRIAL